MVSGLMAAASGELRSRTGEPGRFRLATEPNRAGSAVREGHQRRRGARGKGPESTLGRKWCFGSTILLDAVKCTGDRDRVKVRTPPDPVTGRTVMELDRLELIRRLCVQIPAPRQHLVRYYGWYSNRARGARGEVRRPVTPDDLSPAAVSRRRSWARLLRKIFEVDPLLCPHCLSPDPVEMRPVAAIREVKVVDRTLGHLWKVGGSDPWEGTTQRGPPTQPAATQ